MSRVEARGASLDAIAQPLSSLELAALGRAAPVSAVELPPELLRLGAELPAPRSTPTAVPDAPTRATLAAVQRIGDHLGALERALDALPPAETSAMRERLERARVLVDCAGALSTLREGVHGALRTARPA